MRTLGLLIVLFLVAGEAWGQGGYYYSISEHPYWQCRFWDAKYVPPIIRNDSLICQIQEPEPRTAYDTTVRKSRGVPFDTRYDVLAFSNVRLEGDTLRWSSEYVGTALYR